MAGLLHSKSSTTAPQTASPTVVEPELEQAPYGNAALAAEIEAEEESGGGQVPVGTDTTTLQFAAGELTIKHGVESAPDASTRTSGRYYLLAELELNEAAGEGDVGFLQTVKAGESGGDWSKKKGDKGISTDERANRTDPATGMRVDRGSATKYKTPFYGMKKNDKDEIEPKDRNNSLGSYGGNKVKMRDRPAIPYSYGKKMTFTTTAMKVAGGQQLGAFTWGFDNGDAWSEITPAKLSEGDVLLDERDAAMKRWNEKSATEGSGIDKVPGVE